MKQVRLFKLPVHFVLLVFAVLWLSSCRSTRNLATTDLKDISVGRLIRNVEQNELDYEDLTIRRINCQFSDGNSKTNFRVNLKARKDEKIMISISKLTLPVGRILLTPDSVTYVNYMDKNFFRDDYSYLSKLLGTDVSFETVQSVLSNDYFSYGNNRTQTDTDVFESSVESGNYVLQTDNQEIISVIREEGTFGVAQRNQATMIFQKMIINPQNFAVRKLEIFDPMNSRSVNIDFGDFTTVEKTDFPGSIDLVFNSPGSEISLTTNLNGFSTERINSFSLNIPKSYEELRVN